MSAKETSYGKKGVRFDDLTGQRFNRLTIISFVEMSPQHRAQWLCKCDCGKEVVLEGKRIKAGNTKSCGCLWLESVSLPPGEAKINAHYLEYKLAAIKRNLTFLITKDEFINLTKNANCFYCRKPSKGIDRVNNNIGYEINNCVSCCRDCNVAKGTKTTSEFLDMVENIYQNMWRNCND